MEHNIKKTGTTTVGMVCKDGIVLAADKRATSGNFIADRRTQKIYNITDDIAVTIAGTASDAQLLVRYGQSELRLKQIRTGKKVSVKEAANLMARLTYENIRKFSVIPGISHFLLAGKDDTGIYLYDIYPDGTISEYEDFVSSGSGSVMVYGVLETLYKKDMTIDEGVKLVVKCVNAAISRDSASGDGIDIYTITQEGAKKIIGKEVRMKIEV